MRRNPILYIIAPILIAFTAFEGLTFGQQAEPDQTVKSQTVKSQTVKSQTVKSQTVKSQTVKSQTVIGQSGYPIPRFLSLGAEEIYLRTGPGSQYPILWVYVRKGFPVEITAEYDVWRRIRDVDGTVGWVHSALLSGKRMVLITGGTRMLYAKPDLSATPVLKAEQGVIGDVERCRQHWCEIEISGTDAWIQKNNIWGVFTDEEIN